MQNLGQRLSKQHTEQVKIIFVGNIDAGKSSLFCRMVDNKFESEGDFISVDFKLKYAQLRNRPIRLSFWDTAGQQKFNSLNPNYYKDAHAILVCYDMTKQQQTNSLQFWLKTVQNNKDPLSNVVIVGCKQDRSGKIKPRFQVKLNQLYGNYRQFSTSSKSGDGVKQLQQYLMSTIKFKNQIINDTFEQINTQAQIKQAPQVGVANTNQQQQEDQQKKCCWCCCC